MKMLVKLNQLDDKGLIWVNPSFILYVIKSLQNRTIVRLVEGENMTLQVAETPEQIVNLINQASK
jgi:hypothetical protein